MNQTSIFRRDYLTIAVRLLLTVGMIAIFYIPNFGGSIQFFFDGAILPFSHFLTAVIIIAIGILEYFTFVHMRINKARNLDQLLRPADEQAHIFFALVLVVLLLGNFYIPTYIALVFIIRELVMYGLRLQYAYAGNGALSEQISGIQRFFFFIAMLISVLGNQPFELWNIPVQDICLIVAAVVSILSLALTYLNMQKLLRESK
ncbi:hypothetical protein [Culicoidibacter larvae]|uniref:Uncharacterized protein n=1 Tax=Culicoidibacter larvae TaxID=2579976 RepID=A0A5R8QGK9_9FIRM|nr:hypothetical protein [Culicoidibacter larvae]TLG76593.1 hypothetical protein FEZ08_02950 [Culicoidibacter larvae]